MKKILFIVVISVIVLLASQVRSDSTPQFMNCPVPANGNYASNKGGLHQIVGGELLFGDDDVYFSGQDGYVQCFCDGTKGIQTNWWKTDLPTNSEWPFEENGSQWNLGNFRYLAQNKEYDCSPKIPPTPPTEPPITPPQVPPTPPSGGGNGPPCLFDGTCPCIGLQGIILESCMNNHKPPATTTPPIILPPPQTPLPPHCCKG